MFFSTKQTQRIDLCSSDKLIAPSEEKGNEEDFLCASVQLKEKHKREKFMGEGHEEDQEDERFECQV